MPSSIPIEACGAVVKALQKHGVGMLDELLEVLEPCGTHRPVNHPVITAQRHAHRRHCPVPAMDCFEE